ncbi:MAG: fructosamine kinase family protein [Acidobacteriota bacterium]|nr:fructosamine kinase family protein [Acidobacteriota bacterium]
MVDQRFWDAVNNRIRERVGSSFDGKPVSSVGGGCINNAERLLDRSGNTAYFVKHNRAELAAMFETEAAGLQAIADTGTIRAPLPICQGIVGGRAFLVLEWLELGGRGDWRAMGEQLAQLHQCRLSEHFGWDGDNFIGATVQTNAKADEWVDFFLSERLEAQRRLVEQRGGSLPRFDELRRALPDLLAGHQPEPSLVHGDLWSGNAAFTIQGDPVIFDPAVYFGDREVDLAMSQLFGGFDRSFYTAYRTTYPTAGGYERRRTLYNLYHVLNHYTLFGGFYLSQANGMIAELLR